MKKYSLYRQDVSKACREHKINYAQELNPEQYEVVTNANGPCLVLAGAGSGKTRTLVYRVAYLLEQGIAPDRILLVTFTNKAAREMIERVEALLKEHPKGLWAGTFHHIGNRILRMYGAKIGLNPNFNIIDEEDAKSLIKGCLKEMAITREQYFPKPAVLKSIISLSANLCLPIREVVEERFAYLESQDISRIEEISRRYTLKKQQTNNLDFDDLLVKWLELLDQDQGVQLKLSYQFQYILVDEYQDTNHLQAAIIRGLTGQQQNVLVVGDDSQSIYSFRGADIGNILNFPKIFPQTKIFKLETNYRSTPEILDLANASIRHNKAQYEKVLRTYKESAEKPICVAARDVYEQAQFICQRILEITRTGDVPLSQIAILFRSHFHSLELEMELNKRGIPYEMRGGLRFFEQAHIKDAIAFLKVLASIHDALAWQRIFDLTSGIGEATSQIIWPQILAHQTLVEILRKDWTSSLPVRAQAGWEKISRKLRKLIKTDPGNIAALLEAIIDEDLRNYIKQSYEHFEDRLDDLDQMIIFAGRYKDLTKFLADVSLSENIQGQTFTGYREGPQEQVILSTIHRAKGLEWKVVFVIALVDGCFPHAKVFEYPKELEEERRLFYVATTRAEQELYLTYPLLASRGATLSRTSCFLKELPEETYEEWSVTEEIIDVAEGENAPRGSAGEKDKPKVDLIDFEVKPF